MLPIVGLLQVILFHSGANYFTTRQPDSTFWSNLPPVCPNVSEVDFNPPPYIPIACLPGLKRKADQPLLPPDVDQAGTFFLNSQSAAVLFTTLFLWGSFLLWDGSILGCNVEFLVCFNIEQKHLQRPSYYAHSPRTERLNRRSVVCKIGSAPQPYGIKNNLTMQNVEKW